MQGPSSNPIGILMSVFYFYAIKGTGGRLQIKKNLHRFSILPTRDVLIPADSEITLEFDSQVFSLRFWYVCIIC